MSLVKVFTDAIKKATGKGAIDAKELARSSGGSLGSTAPSQGGAFDPLRPAPGSPGLVDESAASGVLPPVASSNSAPETKVPDEPLPPSEPGPSIDDGGGTPTPPSAPFEPVTVKFPNTQAQGGGLPDAPDGGDKIAGLRRPPTGIKAEGVEPPLGSSDSEEGGEVSEAGKTDLDEGFIRRLRLVDDGSTVIEGGDTPESTEYSGETTRQGTPLVQVGSGGDGSEGGGGSGPHPPGPGTGGSEGEPELISFVDRRGGATQPSNPFKVEMEEVLVSPAAASSEVAPLDDPELEEDSGPGLVMHPGTKGSHPKFHETLVGSGDAEREASSPDGSPTDGDSLARKAGEGQKDFLKIELKEAFISREASGGSGGIDSGMKERGEKADIALFSRESGDGIDGESSTKDHKGEIELARRTGVKDAHDRPADVGSPEPKPVNALAADDDDDLESNTLLDLRAKPVAAGMQPGLAGRMVENLDPDGAADLDDDADADTDESEL